MPLMIASDDREALIYEIASRNFTAKELASKYSTDIATLKAFVEENREEIEETRQEEFESDDEDLTPSQLKELWITNKYERLKRYQKVADKLLNVKVHDATSLRELRSYMRYAAEELGQLLHRGAGQNADDSSVKFEIEGIDMEKLQ